MTKGQEMPPGRARRPGRRRLGLLLTPSLVVVGLLFALPLARLIWASFTEGAGFSLDLYRQALSPDDVFLTILARTAWIALLVSLATLVLGYPLAYLANRVRPLLGALLIAAVCLPFFTSALVRTYAWRVLLADNGPVNGVLLDWGLVDQPVQLVYNDIGVVVGMTQILLPMMVFPLFSTMRTIDPSLTRAAQSMGASPFSAWRTVFLPQSAPGVTTGLTIVFISALGYYITPVLLQGPSTPLFAQRIDSLVNLPGQQGYVAAQSAIVLFVAATLMFLFRHRLGLVLEAETSTPAPATSGSRLGAVLRRVPTAIAGGTGWSAAHRLQVGIGRFISVLRWPVVAVFTTAALVVALTPLVAIVMLGFSDESFLAFPPSGYSTRWFQAYFENTEWLSSTALSISVSLAAAVIATAIAALAAFAFARMRSPRLVVGSYLVMVAPMIVPQVILAVALLYLFLAFDIAGTGVALVLGYVILGLPLAIVVLTTAFRNLDVRYERAAASLGASPVRTARTVVLPLILPSLISALLFVLVTAFSDLVIAQFLGGIDAQTLERQMYRSIREEVSPEVAAVGTLLLGVVVTLGVLVALLTRPVRDAVATMLRIRKS